jgi:hypothetical protein
MVKEGESMSGQGRGIMGGFEKRTILLKLKYYLRRYKQYIFERVTRDPVSLGRRKTRPYPAVLS